MRTVYIVKDKAKCGEREFYDQWSKLTKKLSKRFDIRFGTHDRNYFIFYGEDL